MLKNKLELVHKTQEIDLRHAKESATKMANDMLTKKLGECRVAYEEELEFIAKQFEEMQAEVQTVKEEKLMLQRKIRDLEEIVVTQ